MRFTKINSTVRAIYIYLFIYLFIYAMKIIGLLKVCFLLGFIGWNLYLMWSSANCRHNVRHIRTIIFFCHQTGMVGHWITVIIINSINIYKTITFHLNRRGRMVVEFTTTCAIVAYPANCRHNVRHIRTIIFFCHQTGMVGHWILRLHTFY
jgi:hypothetical protein